jgi:hypothetical protein
MSRTVGMAIRNGAKLWAPRFLDISAEEVCPIGEDLREVLCGEAV